MLFVIPLTHYHNYGGFLCRILHYFKILYILTHNPPSLWSTFRPARVCGINFCDLTSTFASLHTHDQENGLWTRNYNLLALLSSSLLTVTMHVFFVVCGIKCWLAPKPTGPVLSRLGIWVYYANVVYGF